jgi:glycosyltransferase involved in cell wall biosynthesis
MRLAFVVQRYGPEVNGGAEHHCRMFAERISQRDDVSQLTVLTTCARGYQDWENHFPPGRCTVEGVEVIRFPTALQRFERTQSLVGSLLTRAKRRLPLLDHAWLWAQGPLAPGLLHHLDEQRERYDAVVFWTYLYYPTALGVQVVPERAVLVPTAHDEGPIYFDLYRDVFGAARAFGFLAPEERDFVLERFGAAGRPYDIIASGVDALEPVPLAEPGPPFLLYLGRVTNSKGVDGMARSFVAFKERHADAELSGTRGAFRGRDLMLRIAGGGSSPDIPERDDIVMEGFVSEQRKAELLSHCEVLLMPSIYESLSLVMLEAFTLEKPTLVDGRCTVTRGHVERGGGGLSYVGDDDFVAQLHAMLADGPRRSAMGQAGKRYVDDNYRWPVVEERFLELVRQAIA